MFTNSTLKAPPNDPFGPAVSISGVASFGTLSGSPTARVDVAEVAALAAGRHRGPRAVILKDAILISAVVGESESTAPPMRTACQPMGIFTVWRSVDRGKTWLS